MNIIETLKMISGVLFISHRNKAAVRGRSPANIGYRFAISDGIITGLSDGRHATSLCPGSRSSPMLLQIRLSYSSGSPKRDASAAWFVAFTSVMSLQSPSFYDPFQFSDGCNRTCGHQPCPKCGQYRETGLGSWKSTKITLRNKRSWQKNRHYRANK
jgi:hypothetical protein